MPQGGFSRDFQRAAELRTDAQRRKEQKDRERIRDLVISKMNPYFEKEIKKIEEGLVLKQEETIAEFIEMMKSRNKLLRFLLWTNVTTILVLSFVLGYFL
tara:strand:- start:22 stop:321 length:300 start_codon:yes stop_codon:yes gene_type:complete